jgi:hypothetical protein
MGSGEHDGQHCQLVLKGQEDIVSDLGPKYENTFLKLFFIFIK